jgi:hypothetical protein
MRAISAAAAAVQAFVHRFGGMPPDPLNAAFWRPVVRNHFIAAARPPVAITSDQLLVSVSVIIYY